MKTNLTTPFDAEIHGNVATTIRELKADGVVSMSLNNLRAVTPTPKTLDGAPRGGNVPWQYAQRFNAVVAECPRFAAFITAECPRLAASTAA